MEQDSFSQLLAGLRAGDEAAARELWQQFEGAVGRGGPGQLLALGSHRPGRAQRTHPVPLVTIWLHV